jgi:hypothetical protein
MHKKVPRKQPNKSTETASPSKCLRSCQQGQSVRSPILCVRVTWWTNFSLRMWRTVTVQTARYSRMLTATFPCWIWKSVYVSVLFIHTPVWPLQETGNTSSINSVKYITQTLHIHRLLAYSVSLTKCRAAATQVPGHKAFFLFTLSVSLFVFTCKECLLFVLTERGLSTINTNAYIYTHQETKDVMFVQNY